jgi:cytochrome c5
MNKHLILAISLVLLVVLMGTILAACGSSSNPTPAAAPSGGSTSDGQTLMETRCTVCHSLTRITTAHKTADQWKTTVDRMISNGAQLNAAEEQTLVTYLAQNYK